MQCTIKSQVNLIQKLFGKAIKRAKLLEVLSHCYGYPNWDTACKMNKLDAYHKRQAHNFHELSALLHEAGAMPMMAKDFIVGIFEQSLVFENVDYLERRTFIHEKDYHNFWASKETAQTHIVEGQCADVIERLIRTITAGSGFALNYNEYSYRSYQGIKDYLKALNHQVDIEIRMLLSPIWIIQEANADKKDIEQLAINQHRMIINGENIKWKSLLTNNRFIGHVIKTKRIEDQCKIERFYLRQDAGQDDVINNAMKTHDINENSGLAEKAKSLLIAGNFPTRAYNVYLMSALILLSDPKVPTLAKASKKIFELINSDGKSLYEKLKTDLLLNEHKIESQDAKALEKLYKEIPENGEEFINLELNCMLPKMFHIQKMVYDGIDINKDSIERKKVEGPFSDNELAYLYNVTRIVVETSSYEEISKANPIELLEFITNYDKMRQHCNTFIGHEKLNGEIIGFLGHHKNRFDDLMRVFQKEIKKKREGEDVNLAQALEVIEMLMQRKLEGYGATAATHGIMC
jgi:hypothetical protein